VQVWAQAQALMPVVQAPVGVLALVQPLAVLWQGQGQQQQ